MEAAVVAELNIWRQIVQCYHVTTEVLAEILMQFWILQVLIFLSSAFPITTESNGWVWSCQCMKRWDIFYNFLLQACTHIAQRNELALFTSSIAHPHVLGSVVMNHKKAVCSFSAYNYPFKMLYIGINSMQVIFHIGFFMGWIQALDTGFCGLCNKKLIHTWHYNFLTMR